MPTETEYKARLMEVESLVQRLMVWGRDLDAPTSEMQACADRIHELYPAFHVRWQRGGLHVWGSVEAPGWAMMPRALHHAAVYFEEVCEDGTARVRKDRYSEDFDPAAIIPTTSPFFHGARVTRKTAWDRVLNGAL